MHAALSMEVTLALSPVWEYVSDQVMGGVSSGQLHLQDVGDRVHARMTGSISLENNGGFVQMAFDLAEAGAAVDAGAWDGIDIELRGNCECYEVRLRTTDLTRPWQSFRQAFPTNGDWQVLRFPFARFAPHRTASDFDPAALRRIGILAIGRAFDADITVRAIRFYRLSDPEAAGKG